MNIELTGEELRWMYSVFKGEFRIVPRRIVSSVIAKGLGIPNLGGAFNLTRAGKVILPLIYGHLSKRHWPARTALG
ncbi:MAG: hypothetical protein GAK35_03751 [Herbaspirillum frisingense]|uniref:Uncharacterized protein n=1 Tax=Herbaspirillum frisingense TaxID=92645 RepID=A0A7V8JSV0_9BURK|nr:MAG: hypothetical protein GAK35_03751 [Herbaspirillum frisingense]